MTVREIGAANEMRTEIDRESGSLICWRDFDVARNGGSAHRVSVEIDEDGAVQNETCDCRGYHYRGTCSHLNAVLARLDSEAA